MEKRKRILEKNIREIKFALSLDYPRSAKSIQDLAMDLMRYEIELENL